MAITTIEGAIGPRRPTEYIEKFTTGGIETVGLGHSFWYVVGRPTAATANASGVAGATCVTPLAGQIPRENPTSGNAYLADFHMCADQVCTVVLVDRLWHNSGLSVTSTSGQTVDSVTLPARDTNGSTNGEGVMCAVEWSTGAGAGAPNLTLSYTDQSGNAGATTPNLVADDGANAGTFEIFSLAAGDTGIRSIQTYTASATRTSGAFHLVMFRVLAMLEVPQIFSPSGIDAFTSGFVRLYDGTVPFFYIIPTSTANTIAMGSYQEVQG